MKNLSLSLSQINESRAESHRWRHHAVANISGEELLLRIPNISLQRVREIPSNELCVFSFDYQPDGSASVIPSTVLRFVASLF